MALIDPLQRIPRCSVEAPGNVTVRLPGYATDATTWYATVLPPGDATGTATCGVTVLLPGYAVEDVPIGIGRTSTDDERLWEEHLAEVEKMLPYLVAAGHYKYVSCLPHYLEAMSALPTFAPDVFTAF